MKLKLIEIVSFQKEEKNKKNLMKKTKEFFAFNYKDKVFLFKKKLKVSKHRILLSSPLVPKKRKKKTGQRLEPFSFWTFLVWMRKRKANRTESSEANFCRLLLVRLQVEREEKKREEKKIRKVQFICRTELDRIERRRN